MIYMINTLQCLDKGIIISNICLNPLYAIIMRLRIIHIQCKGIINSLEIR